MPRRLVFSTSNFAPVPRASSDVHKRLAVGARVDQRANRHVSADAGERV